MRPTLNPEESLFYDVVLINLLGPNASRKIQPGDVVLAVRKSRRLIKRIEKIVLVEGLQQYWLESDSKDGQAYYDSSFFGPVPKQSVKGVATWIIFPPHRIRKL